MVPDLHVPRDADPSDCKVRTDISWPPVLWGGVARTLLKKDVVWCHVQNKGGVYGLQSVFPTVWREADRPVVLEGGKVLFS